jgi:hypothetical protein
LALTKVTEGIRTLGTGEVAIGNISGSAAGAAGTFLKQDGTWAVVASGIEWQAVQTTGFTAVAEKGYPCNTTAGAFTVTLPSSASAGDQIALVDYAGNFGTNAVTLAPNGLKINSSTDDRTLVTDRLGVYLTYVDATQGWIATSGANTGSRALTPTPYSIDFLVIGGGGGGGAGQQTGQAGGGGGAGGYRTSTQTSVVGNVITITVGDGAAGTRTNTAPAVNGTDSSIVATGLTTITSTGGGGGAMFSIGTGGTGGSGGGGGSVSGIGGAGNTPSTSPVQGYAGGASSSSGSGNTTGGGGGGSSAVGADAVSTNGGAGGAGTASSITGASVTRAGGGGGGSNTGTAGAAGTGGAGIGGYGNQAGADGTANTGSGGGGGSNVGASTASTRGGNGGDGVVIMSVPTSAYSGVTTGSPTVATHLTKTILTFTGSGSYTE